jgi:hypothetical protein
MAEHLLCGQSLGQSAVIKSLATPANPGADADLSAGSGGLARHQLAAHRSQPAKSDVAQPVAQKLAASGARIWRMSVHVSAICTNLLHPAQPGLPFFAQALTFFVLFTSVPTGIIP